MAAVHVHFVYGGAWALPCEPVVTESFPARLASTGIRRIYCVLKLGYGIYEAPKMECC